MQRAAATARKTAVQTDTEVVVVRDGAPARIPAEQLRGEGVSGETSFTLRNRNPDVLSCIANLSNDEVFTPPEFANRMLDTLATAWTSDNDGADIWSDSNVTFLDPCTKSGVFLREIAKRLIVGLSTDIPDLQERVDHILTKQVFGIGITKLTAFLARRSLYCSKHATGAHSVVSSFENDSGNVWFERTEHLWVGEKCKFCGTSKNMLDRGDEVETYAYPFTHTNNAQTLIKKLFGADMQFDVVIGNPPYQLETDGHGNQARPIYHQFVMQGKKLEPRYLVMVTPSRWFSGGMGLSDFRDSMLSDKRMRRIVDFPKLYEAFPGVKIRGGVSYFLWDREHDGPCEIEAIWDGRPLGSIVSRDINAYDILVRSNEAIPILEKVRIKEEPTLDARVSGQKPFGLATNFKGRASSVGMVSPVKLYANQHVAWVERAEVPTNRDWIDEWKVLMTRIQGTSGAIENKFLSRPIVVGPGTACTETYLVAGHFGDEDTALKYADYLRTRFVRFLVSLRKPSQDALRSVYGFVPDLPLTEEWTDRKLYTRYGLSIDEVAYIETVVAEHAGTQLVDD